jgi:4-carboxymuconolactone decarboxylase
MVQLASMIGSHAVSEYRVMLTAALTVGVSPVEVKEIVYQAVPYVGMAKVFDVIHATNAVFTDRGIELPLPGQSTTTPARRELLTLAMLVSLGGCEPQVKGHVAANLNIGNDRAVLLDVITQLLPFIGYPRALNALRVLDEATPPASG